MILIHNPYPTQLDYSLIQYIVLRDLLFLKNTALILLADFMFLQRQMSKALLKSFLPVQQLLTMNFEAKLL
jgi:hypothetical protein